MLLVKNKKALRNYEIIEKYLAGIVLKGYEVKALREKKANLEGAYVKIINNEPYISGMHIGRYSKQSQEHVEADARSDRKLLLNSKELMRLRQEIEQKGKTAVPLALLLKNNMIKLELAVVKGRKEYGKKHLEKEKQIKRDMEIEAKQLLK